MTLKKMSAIAGVVGVVITIGATAVTLARENAWRDDVTVVEQKVVKSIESLMEQQQQRQCDYVVDRLNELKAKERYNQMTEYDMVRRDQLQVEKERVCKNE